jgi:hypothetical protein
MGWFKKLKKEELLWKRVKLCFFYDQDDEVVQEWCAADVGDYYIVCETAGLQVCYKVPKPLIALFMREKGLDDTKLSCA